MTMPSRLTAPWLSRETTQRVMKLIAAAGYEARAVGGCVRDTLRGGQHVTDVDLASSMPAEDLLALLATHKIKAVPTGLAHGTITVLMPAPSGELHKFEVTTLRRDVETDGRHAVTAYSNNWLDDARRRDFTVNAIYAGADGTLYDPLFEAGEGNALKDLAMNRVRFIGDPRTRICEDYLRIMRFFRFHFLLASGATLPDEAALDACRAELDGLKRLSRERITDELIKTARLMNFRAAMQSLVESGVIEKIMPSLSVKALITDEALERLCALSDDPILRLGLVFSLQKDLSPVFSALRLPNAVIKRWKQMTDPQIARALEGAQLSDLERLAYWHGKQSLYDQILLQMARCSGGFEQFHIDHIRAWQPMLFPVGGQDLMAAGLPSGPKMGLQLQRLERIWVDSNFTLTRADLLAQIEK